MRDVCSKVIIVTPEQRPYVFVFNFEQLKTKAAIMTVDFVY